MLKSLVNVLRKYFYLVDNWRIKTKGKIGENPWGKIPMEILPRLPKGRSYQYYYFYILSGSKILSWQI